MVMLSRDQFNKALGKALQAAREARGLTRAELAKNLKERPLDPETYLRQLAALGVMAEYIRRRTRLTQEEVARRGRIPVSFVRELETSHIPNPDSYLIYCLTCGLDIPYSELQKKVDRLAQTPLDENDRPIPRKRKTKIE